MADDNKPEDPAKPDINAAAQFKVTGYQTTIGDKLDKRFTTPITGELKCPEGQMITHWISNGDPERIPPIGTKLEIRPHVLFIVKGYGNCVDYNDPAQKSPTGKIFKLELYGSIIIPKGSPIDTLYNLMHDPTITPKKEDK